MQPHKYLSKICMHPRRTMPKTFRRGTPSESRADESDEARRKAVPPANAFDSAAEDVRLGWVRDAARGEVRSSRFRNARPDLDPVGSLSYALSPIRRSGRRSRKLCPRTPSTSWLSCGEALSTLMARGRLLSAAIATIFVPLPRRVGPTARPLF